MELNILHFWFIVRDCFCWVRWSYFFFVLGDLFLWSLCIPWNVVFGYKFIKKKKKIQNMTNLTKNEKKIDFFLKNFTKNWLNGKVMIFFFEKSKFPKISFGKINGKKRWNFLNFLLNTIIPNMSILILGT